MIYKNQPDNFTLTSYMFLEDQDCALELPKLGEENSLVWKMFIENSILYCKCGTGELGFHLTWN